MRRSRVRRYCVAIVLASTLLLGSSALAYSPGSDGTTVSSASGMTTTGPTVIASQQGRLLVYAANGTQVFETTRHDVYHDVDPSPVGDRTVVVVAADDIRCAYPDCSRVLVERINVTTGDREVLWESTTIGKGPLNWHDVDRVSNDTFLVADISSDRVYELNTSTGIETWGWSAQHAFGREAASRPVSAGGASFTDWMHLNDVERVSNTTVMVSLRNQDEVVFVHETRGLLEARTLGEDGAHSTLNEQHNPDYIGADRGGPAVLVADSTNDRIVEYQFVDGEYRRTWVWTSPSTSWPRDADRLPNGHTLITDSNANRVIQVDRAGEIVWSVRVQSPYDAERLGTGDESAGGPSATRAGLRSRRPAPDGPRSLSERIKGLFPTIVVHALMFVTPGWVGVPEFALLGLSSGATTVWLGVEAYYSRLSVRSPLVW